MDKRLSFVALILVIACSLSSNSAASDAAGQEQETRWQASSEKKFKMKFETTPATNYCSAQTSIEYYQSDKIANVQGEINVDGCTNASGQYTISVRFRDEEGETHNLEFDETWNSDSAAPAKFSHEYAMAENVDLIRARARRTRCVCNDDESDDDDQDISPQIEPRKDQ